MAVERGLEAGQPGGPPSVGRELTGAVQVAASILGLGGYVYLIGGIVSWVRYGAARLPSDAAVAVLDTQTMFVVGLRAIVLSAIAFSALCVVAYFAAGNWEANGPDWHELIGRGGVGRATGKRTDSDVKAWKARRAKATSASRARRWHRVARAADRVGLTPVSKAVTARHGSAQDVKAGRPAAAASAYQSPLGDRAVRVVAGFNNLVLSAVAGLTVARFVEWLFPDAWWAILVAGLAAGFGADWVMVRWGPLRWGPGAHGVVWLIVVAAALFVSAPVGLLVIAGIAVSTLGRALARVQRPRSLAELLRSPLPWALFTFYTLVGLAYAAIPPVSFPQAVVATTRGVRVGGLLSRSGGDVYLVTCTPLADATSTNERVVRISGADVRELTLGGTEDVVDSGERPSIAALAMRGLGIDAHPPTFFRLDLRARRATCAGTQPASLSVGTEDPALGSGAIVGPTPPGRRAHDGELPIEKTTPAAIAQLARRYQPTVEVTVADRFWPVSVGALLNDVGAQDQRTCLVAAPGSPCVPVTSLASLAPAGSQRSAYLRYPAKLKNDPTNQFEAFERGQSISPGSLHDWLVDPGVLDPWYTAQVYFYYAGPIATGQWPQGARDPNVASGLIGLEYWFYYPFNYYPTVVGAGLMDGAPLAGDSVNTDLHQGDWEHVVVLLDPTTLKPLWLYMARHAGEGKFFPWDSPTLAFDQGHPIVQGAFGGHPSYPNRCGAQPRALLRNLSSDWVVCGSGRFAFPAATTPLVDLATTSWGCWKGHLGEAKPGLEVNRTSEADSVLTQAREFVFVAGPPSPLWQAENAGVCSGAGPRAPETAAADRLARAQHSGATRRT